MTSRGGTISCVLSATSAKSSNLGAVSPLACERFLRSTWHGERRRFANVKICCISALQGQHFWTDYLYRIALPPNLPAANTIDLKEELHSEVCCWLSRSATRAGSQSRNAGAR
jgi:hypothetical protein